MLFTLLVHGSELEINFVEGRTVTRCTVLVEQNSLLTKHAKLRFF